MESHDALVRDALDACTGPALALDARGRVLAANAALLIRLGLPGDAGSDALDRLRVEGPALTRRRRAAAALDVLVAGRAPMRFQATLRRDARCGRTLAVLREDDTPASAATLLERQLDLREHVGDDHGRLLPRSDRDAGRDARGRARRHLAVRRRRHGARVHRPLPAQRAAP